MPTRRAVVVLKARILATGLALLALAAAAGVTMAVRDAHRAAQPRQHAAPHAVPSVRVQHGFPDARNAGVPAGVRLRAVPGQVSKGQGWRFDPRGWVDVYGRGAVLSGLDIPWNVNISA